MSSLYDDERYRRTLKEIDSEYLRRARRRVIEGRIMKGALVAVVLFAFLYPVLRRIF